MHAGRSNEFPVVYVVSRGIFVFRNQDLSKAIMLFAQFFVAAAKRTISFS